MAQNEYIKSPAKSNRGNSDYTDIMTEKAWKSLRVDNGLHSSKEIDLYDNIYRYGLMNPYDALSVTREYLFFTKPDLHISQMDESTGTCNTNNLNSELQGNLFWDDLYKYRRDTVSMLQASYSTKNPFNYLLQNSCISNLEVPQITSESIETPQNIYGVSYTYRGSSEDSDDNPEFALEFRDTKWLDIYMYFKAYEEYETLKHHGEVTPWQGYITRKVIHDAFSIYKFLVDEDMETIIYYGKMYGVTPTSLPRDVFGSSTFDNGLSYSINFKAAFYEDMKIDILSDFNYLAKNYAMTNCDHDINIYDNKLHRVSGEPANGAYITAEANSESPTGYVYKLKWRGRSK